jgi:hypothetical protein
VDDGYYRFAEEYGWDGAGDSLGRSLWDFVDGEEVRNLQRLLVRRIREQARSVELPVRCETPDVQLDTTLRIAANRSRRVVLFTARLDAERQREHQPLLDSEAKRSDEVLQMCAWCDRFLVGDEWVGIEEAAVQLELFRRAELPTIGHSICPDCAEMLMAA